MPETQTERCQELFFATWRLCVFAFSWSMDSTPRRKGAETQRYEDVGADRAYSQTGDIPPALWMNTHEDSLVSFYRNVSG